MHSRHWCCGLWPARRGNCKRFGLRYCFSLCEMQKASACCAAVTGAVLEHDCRFQGFCKILLHAKEAMQAKQPGCNLQARRIWEAVLYAQPKVRTDEGLANLAQLVSSFTHHHAWLHSTQGAASQGCKTAAHVGTHLCLCAFVIDLHAL